MKSSKFMRAAMLVLCSLTVVSCTEAVPPEPVTSRLDLRDDMRELWTAHVTWTRVVLVGAIAGLPDTGFAIDRLLANQDDIGDAVRPFYGDQAADELTALLHTHIELALAIVDAGLTGDQAAFAAANAAWYANADDIARFLADANPHWDFDELSYMMRAHLDQTLIEATARFDQSWSLDVAAYDAIVRHALHLADTLTDGLEQQFPELVSVSTITAEDEALHITMRELWQDEATWMRCYLISFLAHLPDVDVASARLLRVQEDLGDTLRESYGDVVADELTGLLDEHVFGATDVFLALEAEDDGRVQAAQTDWHENAEDLALFFASTSSHIRLEEMRALLGTHLDRTTAESTTRLEGDWAADVVAYDAVVTNILQTADVLSTGISRHLSGY